MRSLITSLLLLLCAPASAGVIPDRIESNLRERVAAGELKAAVVAMIDGDATAIEGFGALEDGKTPDGDSVFEIGSVTKTFTATLLAEDVVKGKLKLDAPVRSLLPGFAVPRSGKQEITLADIAEQDSGLPRMPDNFQPKDQTDPFADYGADRLKEFLAGYKLPRAPGASYEYSNLAVGLLGYGLAQNHHQSYGDLVAARILKPLGMSSSGLKPEPVVGFDAAGKPVHSWHFDALAGAGALRSTGADMLRYLQAYMGRTATPLRPAMELAKTARKDAAPGFRIGLIWMTNPTPDGPVIWHNGMTGGYASFAGFTADGKRGVVILANEARTLDDLGFAALSEKAPLAPVRKEIEVPAEKLDAYVGTYRLKDKFFISVIKGGGKLFARATGQQIFPLYASGEGEFFAKVADVAISFTPAGLTLHQGADFPCPKVTELEAAAELGAVAVDAKILETYAGRYQLAPGQIFTITRQDGHLVGQLGTQPALPLFPRSATSFFYLAADAEMDFQPDASSLILHQGGRNLTAPRLP